MEVLNFQDLIASTDNNTTGYITSTTWFAGHLLRVNEHSFALLIYFLILLKHMPEYAYLDTTG